MNKAIMNVPRAAFWGGLRLSDWMMDWLDYGEQHWPMLVIVLCLTGIVYLALPRRAI